MPSKDRNPRCWQIRTDTEELFESPRSRADVIHGCGDPVEPFDRDVGRVFRVAPAVRIRLNELDGETDGMRDAHVREKDPEKRADDGRAYLLNEDQTALEIPREGHHEEHEGQKGDGMVDHHL